MAQLHQPMNAGDIAKAENIRDIARELLARADELDGDVPCECQHMRRQHDPAGWNQGWCDSSDCKCEEFKAW